MTSFVSSALLFNPRAPWPRKTAGANPQLDVVVVCCGRRGRGLFDLPLSGRAAR